MKFLTKIFFTSVVVIIIILTPIIFFLNNNSYFMSKFEQYNVYQNFDTKYSKAFINNKFEDMMNLINGRVNDLDQNYWSKEDVYHLQDVRAIILVAYATYFLSLVIIIFTILKEKKEFSARLKYPAIIILTIIPILIILSFFDFNSLFIVFHKILFRNDYWILDPSTSNLIKYFPEKIFFEIACYTGFFAIITSILLLILWQRTRK